MCVGGARGAPSRVQNQARGFSTCTHLGCDLLKVVLRQVDEHHPQRPQHRQAPRRVLVGVRPHLRMVPTGRRGHYGARNLGALLRQPSATVRPCVWVCCVADDLAADRAVEGGSKRQGTTLTTVTVIPDNTEPITCDIVAKAYWVTAPQTLLGDMAARR